MTLTFDAWGEPWHLDLLALEMVANQAGEETLLNLEMAGLPFRWRQEEELAALVDWTLTPLSPSAWESLARRFRGKGKG